jgi:hypothetical protein
MRVVSAPDLPQVTMPPNEPEAASDQVSPLFLSHVTKEGFSGAIWLEPPVIAHPSLERTSAPPLWLRLNTHTLGTALPEFLVRLVPPVSLRPILPEPEFAPPASLPPPARVSQPSRLRLEGDLAARAPNELPRLKDWETNSLLHPTVFEVGVDPSGNVISLVPATRSDFVPGPNSGRPPPVLPALSGSAEADRYAASIAAGLRFQPRFKSAPGTPVHQITYGRLVFEWRTIPAAGSNAPSQSP